LNTVGQNPTPGPALAAITAVINPLATQDVKDLARAGEKSQYAVQIRVRW
jgi:hypothetical protein